MEMTANNVANLSTPGFKAQRLYSTVSAATDLHAPQQLISERLDLAQGQLMSSKNPLDLAISGIGMFRLRGGDGVIAYSRSGQFKLDADGRVINAQGMTLQAADGGDLILPNAQVTIQNDGTILDGDKPVSKLSLYQLPQGEEAEAIGGSLVTAPESEVEEVASPQLRQGMVESSNVSLASEMMTMMDAMRQAGGAAKIVQTYDDLVGKAISTLGQAR